MNIAERIRRQRERVGITLREVALAVGVAESTILRWENGETSKMDMNKVELLAKVLKCSPAYIMGWEEIEKKYELVDLYDQATEEQKKEILAFIEFKVRHKQ